MSIYSTLWILKFPENGDSHTGCDWVSVIAQGVGSQIGSLDDVTEDPYSSFLPPAISESEFPEGFRAVIFVSESTKKGTERSQQEYESPLLVLSGKDYAEMMFEELHEILCSKLRGDRGRVIAEFHKPAGTIKLIRE